MAEPIQPPPANPGAVGVWKNGVDTKVVRAASGGHFTILLTEEVTRALAVALHAFDDGLAPRLRPLRQALDWHLVGDPNPRARGPARRG